MAEPDLIDMEGIIVTCFKSKKSDRINSLCSWLCGERDVKTVDGCWFKKDSSVKTDVKGVQKMLKAFMMAIFNLLEGSKEHHVNTKDLSSFLIGKCKLTKLIVNNLKSESSESCVKDSCHQVLFLSLYLMKHIVKNKQYSSSQCIQDLLRGKCIEALVGIILADAKNILTVIAVDLLCCFCVINRDAVDRVVGCDGLDAITFFYEKDRAQKYLAKVGKDHKHFYLDSKFAAYEVSDIDPFDTIKSIDWVVMSSSVSLDAEHAMQRQLQTGYALRKCAAKVLVKIADGSNSLRKQIFNNDQIMKAVLGWLSYPLVSTNCFSMYEASTTLITRLLQLEDLSSKIIRDHNLLRIIEVGVFCPIWRISRHFQHIAYYIANHGGKTRAKLAGSEDMFIVFASELYSVDQSVKPEFYPLLTTLAQGIETANALFKAGLTPQALMDTDHYYGHSYANGRHRLEDARQALNANVKEWKKAEENLVINKHKEERHIRCKIEHKKKDGNEAFQAQKYEEAIDLYTEAITICPIRILCPDGTNCPSFKNAVNKEEALYHWWVVPAQLFGNRAQCHLKLENWKAAVADCTRALCACWIPDNEGGPQRKKIFVKVTYRRARAFFELKDYHRALNDIACCIQEEPNDDNIKKFYNECLLLYRKHHGRELIAHCANCGAGDGFSLRRCGNCFQFYCSTQCQSVDWENGHQDSCDKFKD